MLGELNKPGYERSKLEMKLEVFQWGSLSVVEMVLCSLKKLLTALK